MWLHLIICNHSIADPNPPTLNAPQADETTITVTWAAPTEGSFSEFEITLYQLDCATVIVQAETIAKDMLAKAYTNQQPGTIYCVKLTTVVNDGGYDRKSAIQEERVTTSKKLKTSFSKFLLYVKLSIRFEY